MKILKLPTIFDCTDPEEADRQEILGLPFTEELKEGSIFINIEHISSFNRDKDGKVTMRIDSNTWTIEMMFEDFYKLLKEYGAEIK